MHTPMFGRVVTIALNTYREASRARVLYGLVGVAIATALYACVVGAYTLRSAPRVVADVGSASISIFAIAVSIMLAATSLYRELEQKTIFPILARPVRRSEYIVGKYLGILLVLVAFIAMDAAVVLSALAIMGGRKAWIVVGIDVVSVVVLVVAAVRNKRLGVHALIPWSVVMLAISAWLANGYPDERRVVLGLCALALLEVSVVAAIATLFSSFSSPFLTALFTLSVFIIGRQADSLAKLPAKVFGSAIHDAGVMLSKVVPNLHIYVPARPLLTGEAIEAAIGPYLGMACVQTAGWVILLLALSTVVFQRRDFL